MSNTGKPRCKVGDLAIITSRCIIPSNVGKIVRVLERDLDFACGVGWHVRSECRSLVYVDAEGGVQSDMEVRAADSILTPITPGSPSKMRRTRKVALQGGAA